MMGHPWHEADRKNVPWLLQHCLPLYRVTALKRIPEICIIGLRFSLRLWAAKEASHCTGELGAEPLLSDDFFERPLTCLTLSFWPGTCISRACALPSKDAMP